jgi:hypothetical protein
MLSHTEVPTKHLPWASQLPDVSPLNCWFTMGTCCLPVSIGHWDERTEQSTSPLLSCGSSGRAEKCTCISQRIKCSWVKIQSETWSAMGVYGLKAPGGRCTGPHSFASCYPHLHTSAVMGPARHPWSVPAVQSPAHRLLHSLP